MPAPSPEPDVVVETRDLVVSYGSNEVLKGIDLTVRRGEVVAIIGPNGSGKSTLIRALIGLAPITSGEKWIFGHRRLEHADREKLGYVPQRVDASGGVPATVAEVVRTGLQAGFFRRTTRDWRPALREALHATGLSELRDRPVSELSGGQQQRVLISRALIRRPSLLVLDEPLAGVDLAQQASFADTLRRLSSEDRTVLLVLHEFGALAPLLSRVIALDNGRIEFDARPEDAPEHCETNDQPEWVRAAHDRAVHDHVHPHDDAHVTAPWVPGLSPAPGARR